MKSVLRFFGIVSGVLGLLAAGFTVPLGFSNEIGDGTIFFIYGIAYLLSGIAGGTIFFALAEILERLPERPHWQSGRATYLPGRDPNEPISPGRKEPK